MLNLLKLFIKFLPFTINILYALFVLDGTKYLDRNLKYTAPELSRAPEDIVGFGFTVSCLIFLTLFLISSAMSFYITRNRGVIFWSVAISLFSIISISDYFIYKIVIRQIIS